MFFIFQRDCLHKYPSMPFLFYHNSPQKATSTKRRETEKNRLRMLTKRVRCDKMTLAIAELCNGSTADSDSVCEGSSPSSAAKRAVPASKRDFIIIAPDARFTRHLIKDRMPDSRGELFNLLNAIQALSQPCCGFVSIHRVWLSLVERLVRDQERLIRK